MTELGAPGPQSYNLRMHHALRKLSNEVRGVDSIPGFNEPRKYTGECIGVEYLYCQTGQSLVALTENREEEEEGDGQDVILVEEENASLEDEGFEEIDPTLLPPPEKAAPDTRRRQAEPCYEAIPLVPVPRVTTSHCYDPGYGAIPLVPVPRVTTNRCKHSQREKRQERVVLSQGLLLSNPPMTASNPLPPAKDLLTALPRATEEEQHQFLLPANTVGLAKTKARQLAKIIPRPSFFLPAAPLLMSPCSTGSLAAVESNVLPNLPYAKSTFTYRKKKGCPTRSYNRKSTPHLCRKCGHPFSEGHRVYFGAIYCPLIATQPVDDWTALQKAIRESKKTDSRKHCNQHGQVLMSVLTDSEGGQLQPMVDSLVRVSPPRLLYVDRHCCLNSNTYKMFAAWPQLIVRLDIWHFMRRIADSVTTDSHPLYASFMSRMSSCIFKWSDEDMTLLVSAKRAQMEATSAAIGFRGTTASDSYFQAYLLEGLARWNQDTAMTELGAPGPQSYNLRMHHALRKLSNEVRGVDSIPGFNEPRKYTGECIGVEYLYCQIGQSLVALTENREEEEEGDGQDVILVEEENASLEDEGFEEIDPTLLPPPEKAAPDTRRRQAEPCKFDIFLKSFIFFSPGYEAIPLVPVPRHSVSANLTLLPPPPENIMTSRRQAEPCYDPGYGAIPLVPVPRVTTNRCKHSERKAAGKGCPWPGFVAVKTTDDSFKSPTTGQGPSDSSTTGHRGGAAPIFAAGQHCRAREDKGEAAGKDNTKTIFLLASCPIADVALIVSEIDDKVVDGYEGQLAEYSSKIDVYTKRVLHIIGGSRQVLNSQEGSTTSTSTRTDAPVYRPKICETLKPFKLNDEHTPVDLRN
ncbi:hypothetical protein GQR58_005949 [Nymphon striatum]|nr:hypothetical protein GQR58_005949 [Nymphon striatum]